MKKLCLFFFLFLTTIAFSQEDAWVYFNAKVNSQSYFDTPLLMLSQRALDRRTNQNIDLDFKDIPMNQDYINQIKLISGIKVMAKSKWLNAIHVRGTQTAINTLKDFVFVDKIDFANKAFNQSGKTVKRVKTSKISSIKEQNKTKKIKADFTYGTSANQIQMLNGQLLHQQNYTGSGKIIAVMDAGFPGVNTILPFQRLRDNNQILGGYNFVARNDNFYVGSSHGTSVLSTMGGFKENTLVGTAPDASYYLFITEDNSSENPVEESLWVEAAEKADSLGVDIINTSLGYFQFDNSAYNHTYNDMNGSTTFMSRGAEIAFSKGMIVVVAAGNEGTTSNPYIAAPADAVSVITVGAVNATKVRANFSSIGPSYDGRIKPDVMAQGVSTVLSDGFGTITTSNGTSFSSPVITGMVASLWQAFPKKTNKEIRELIIKSADRFTVPTNQYGYGIPDFSLALSSGTLSVSQFSDANFTLYPNPTTDFISVSFPESFNKGKVIIYTFLGQKILERDLNGQTDSISLHSLSSGVYIYKIESDSFSKSGKIIKQ